MRRMHRSCIRGAIAAISLIAWLTPAVALAKDEKPLPPYDVSGLPHSSVWIPWVFAFFFAAAVVAIGFKNPHRTHLD